MKTMDMLCIQAMGKANLCKDRLCDFWKNQDGVSNVVATIIILAIVVGMIAMFNDELQSWLQEFMDAIFDEHNADSYTW